MRFTQAIKTCLQKCVNFSGRAPRSEFWWWFLFFLIAPFALFRLIPVSILAAINALSTALDTPFSWLFPIAAPLTVIYYTGATIFYLALFVPTCAIIARRLHDINRSGWWQAIPHVMAIPIYINFGKLIANEIAEPSMLLLVSANLSRLTLLALLICFIFKGTKGENRFGADPLARA